MRLTKIKRIQLSRSKQRKARVGNGLRAPARQRATGRILQLGEPPNVRATQSEADRDSLVDNTSNLFSTTHRQSVAHDRTMMMPGDVSGEAARRNSPKFSGLIALEENAEDRTGTRTRYGAIRIIAS
jgi:hypothetical protein